VIVGIDFDSHSLDLVGLDEERGEAQWQKVHIANKKGEDAFERARNVRDALPPRTSWLDEGVILVAIEDPRGEQKGASTLFRVQGAVLSCLPRTVPVLALPPWEWRKACGMSGSGRTEELKRQASVFALRHWTNSPPEVGQDGLDAYCIAWGAREICTRAAEAAERNVA
jgi:hypothetical protein